MHTWSLEKYCIFCADFHEASKCSPALYADTLHTVSSILGQECRKYRQKFIYTHKWRMTHCPDFHKNCSHSNKCIWKPSVPNCIQIWRKTCKMWCIFIDAITWSVGFMTSVFSKLSTQRCYMEISRTDFHRNHSRTIKVTGRNTLMGVCEVWLSLYRFLGSSVFWYCVVLFNSLPSFLEFRQKVYRWWWSQTTVGRTDGRCLHIKRLSQQIMPKSDILLIIYIK